MIGRKRICRFCVLETAILGDTIRKMDCNIKTDGQIAKGIERFLEMLQTLHSWEGEQSGAVQIDGEGNFQGM